MKTLENIYKNIPENRIKATRNWYKEAHSFAANLSETYKISFNRVCAVISALSPANNWDNNKTEAENLIVCFISGGNWQLIPFRTYSANVSKAWNILTNYSKSTEDFFSVKTGAKTLNFYENIKNPKDPNFVTIDRHMLAILDGRLGQRSGSGRITTKQYRELSAELKKVAKKLGLLPNELQAILWEYHLMLIEN